LKTNGDYDELESEAPISVALSRFHLILLFRDRVKAICILNDEVVYEERIPLEYGEQVVSMEIDSINNTFWIYTNTILYELIINEEDRNGRAKLKSHYERN
jgi:hypothetical protein